MQAANKRVISIEDNAAMTFQSQMLESFEQLLQRRNQRAHLKLVAIAFFFAFSFCSLDTHLLVVFLQSRKVLASLAEFSLFHAFADVPMHKCTLAVHEVELVINAREPLCDGRGITDHATRAHDFSQIATRNDSRRLVIDATLEASRTPVNELNGTFRLDRSNGCVDILWYDVATVHHTARHVLSMARVALDKHGRWLEYTPH